MPVAWSCMTAGCTSMIEAVLAHARRIFERPKARPRGAQLQASRAPLPNFEAPIVPHQSIGGRALMAVVAIMTYLASLTTGAVMLVRANASDWQSEVLREAMETLPERDRHIIEARKLSDSPMKLEELGKHYGVSRERIRQIEARAFEKISKLVKEAAQERGYVGAA